MDLSFHGVEVQPATGASLALDGAGGASKVFVRSTLRREKIKPQVGGRNLTLSLIAS